MCIVSVPECFICDKALEDGTKTTIVREKGLKSFAEASKMRGDGKVTLFRGTSLEVHEKCRKQCTNDKLIAASIKRAKEGVQVQQLRSSVPTFAFKTHCFLCGDKIPSNYADKQNDFLLSNAILCIL